MLLDSTVNLVEQVALKMSQEAKINTTQQACQVASATQKSALLGEPRRQTMQMSETN